MKEERPAYNLEVRTYQFALQVRFCISGTNWSREQWTGVGQAFRSSGSVAANCSEANNAASKRDFLFRIRISKKEASECKHWLRLLGETSNDASLKLALRTLYKESDELTCILATILRDSQD
jgi:four helix bundle protein